MRALPSVVVAEIGDDDDEAGLPSKSGQPPQPGRHPVDVLVAVDRDALGEQPRERDHPRLRAPWSQDPRSLCAGRQQPDAAGAADPDPPEHECDAFGDIGLQPPRRAERHRRGDVEHDPRRQRPLRDMQADVRHARAARGRGRVDVTDVIADLVRPDLGEFHPEPNPRRAAFARQRPRQQPVDRDVERLDQRLWDRAGTLASRRRLNEVGRHPAAATGLVRWRRPGSVTAASTRSSSSSAVTPSLSAS